MAEILGLFFQQLFADIVQLLIDAMIGGWFTWPGVGG